MLRSTAVMSWLQAVATSYRECRPPLLAYLKFALTAEAHRPTLNQSQVRWWGRQATTALMQGWRLFPHLQPLGIGSSCGGMAKVGEGKNVIRVARVHVTHRQAQILDLAARDFADKQIAERLGVSVSTVRTQLQRFYKANGLHSRTGAVGLWLPG